MAGKGSYSISVVVDPDFTKSAALENVYIEDPIDTDSTEVEVKEEILDETNITEEIRPLPEPSLSPPLHSNTPPNTSVNLQNLILQNEREERSKRANELHDLEVIILKEKHREAKAKADLAELLLEQQENEVRKRRARDRDLQLLKEKFRKTYG